MYVCLSLLSVCYFRFSYLVSLVSLSTAFFLLSPVVQNRFVAIFGGVNQVCMLSLLPPSLSLSLSKPSLLFFILCVSCLQEQYCDLHTLDTHTLTWDEPFINGDPPKPRQGHASAAVRYFFHNF